MFISIEGTDASGKSTLTDKIADILSRDNPGAEVERYHKGAPQELTRAWALQDYVEGVAKKRWNEQHAVADRWHWGEITYAPLKRPYTSTDGYGLLGTSGWRWVEMFMASRGMTQFWLYQPLEVIQCRLTSRGDDFVDVSELPKILSLYQTAYDNTLSCMKICPPDNASDAAITATAETIIKAARIVSDAVEFLVDYPMYIGPGKPKALLVGDERNDETDTFLPFKPTTGNSGDYLIRSLPEYAWRQYGIVNSADINAEQLNSLHAALGRPRVVALGRIAEKRLQKADMRSVVLPHPQYVRRFQYNDNTEYGRAIDCFADGKIEEMTQWLLR